MPLPHEIPESLNVLVVDHPLAAARLSTMRDARSDNATFRAALRDLTLMLIYEAGRSLATEPFTIHTPVARTTRHSGSPTRRCWCRCCGPAWAWPTRRTR